MPKFLDKTGMVFDQLTVIKYVGKNKKADGKSRGSLFECKCSCGNVVIRPSNNLRINKNHGTNCGSCKTTALTNEEGNIFESKNYGKYVVEKYIDSTLIHIRFILTGFTRTIDAKSLRDGSVKDPYCPSVFGVGYLGEGIYAASYNKNGKKVNTPAYEVWLGKIKTCYWETKRKHLYKDQGVTVCNEWHNFQNFAKWFYIQVKLYGKGGSVDKDLLLLGNREYSPDSCAYVPPAVNSLFTGASGNISGVHWCNTQQKWVAQIQRGELTATGKSKQSYLGRFDCKQTADAAYYSAKLAHVKSVVLKYQDQIPPALFYKMYHGTENYLNYYMLTKEKSNE